MAWSFSAAAGPALGQVNAHSAARVTVVTVTAGKPTELGFKLSKFSALPAGTITFKVTNMGYAFHNFKICTNPASSAAKTSCVGQATPTLKHGQTATLTVVLTKSGMYEYLCAITGHAASGMKGLIGIGVKVTPSANPPVHAGPAPGGSAPAPVPAPVPLPAPGGGGGAASDGCPAGVTIQTSGASDQDSDEGGAPSDGDGCI